MDKIPIITLLGFQTPTWFTKDVDISFGCWIWLGRIETTGGYGRIRGGQYKDWRAHRLSFLWFVGPITVGHEIHHTCSNKLCINPLHLVSLTKAEHRLIEIGLGNVSNGNKNKTHCKQGHQFTTKNTYTVRTKNGQIRGRSCLICRRQSSIKWYYDKTKKV